jgi:hypothetical protein
MEMVPGSWTSLNATAKQEQCLRLNLLSSENNDCRIRGYHSGVNEEGYLLGYNTVKVHRWFGGTYCFHLQGQKISRARYRCESSPIAQAVSRCLPTAAARVRTWVWSGEICGEQSCAGASFLRVLRFPLPIFIPPNSPSSQSAGSRTIGQKWTCRVDPVWTPPIGEFFLYQCESRWQASMLPRLYLSRLILRPWRRGRCSPEMWEASEGLHGVTRLAMGWTPERSEFETRYGQEFSHLHVVQIGSGVQPTSYTMVQGALSRG